MSLHKFEVFTKHTCCESDNTFDHLILVIAQLLSKKIDPAGNQKHIIKFSWPKVNQYKVQPESSQAVDSSADPLDSLAKVNSQVS